MYKWLCLVVASLLVLLNVAKADSGSSDSVEFERLARSFPYSVSLYRMLGHDRELRPYYGADDEMAALIDGLNKDTLGAPRLRRSGGQQMKSFGLGYSWNTPPKLPVRHFQNGYACRFKFCRIFDA